MKQFTCIVFFVLTACGGHENVTSSRLSAWRYDGKKSTVCIFNWTKEIAYLTIGGYDEGHSEYDASFYPTIYPIKHTKGKVVHIDAYPIVVSLTSGGVSIRESLFPPKSGDVSSSERVPADQCKRTYSYRLDVENTRIKGKILKLNRASWTP